MSVYNGERYVKSAIDSILNQTFQDFEFIIVDDASTDRTYEILQRYADDRICILRNKTNKGLTKNLNMLLKLSRGMYIARMDADDISFPERFMRQVDFLNKNKDIYLISCSYREFGSRYGKNIIKLNENEIKVQFLFGSVLPHPGFMFRKELIDTYHIFYNQEMKYAQDYDFQVRVSRRFHIACLPQILLYYRISLEQISENKSQEQKVYANQVRYKVFREYGIPCSMKQVEVLSKLYYGKDFLSLSECVTFLRLILLVCRVVYKNENRESQLILSKLLEYVSKIKGV